MKLISHKERSDLIVQIMLDYEPQTDLIISSGQELNSIYHIILKDFSKRQDTEYFKPFYTIPFLNFTTFRSRLLNSNYIENEFKKIGDTKSIQIRLIGEKDTNFLSITRKQLNEIKSILIGQDD